MWYIHTLSACLGFLSCRIVCDEWIELRFPDAEAIQDFISKAFHIRDSWQSLLQKAFEGTLFDVLRKVFQQFKS